MVWNSTQSALYKAIDTHNSVFSEPKNSAEKNACKNVEKKPVSSRENDAEKRSENTAGKCCKKCSENSDLRGFVNCRNNTAVPSDPIARILSDGDMLLIAGLMFVLWRENADKRLIIALAIVLFG